MAKLILIRHGETEKNVIGKLHQADDPEVLNFKGRRQMQNLAQKLRVFLPLSSPAG